jgi:hypothetical protein
MTKQDVHTPETAIAEQRAVAAYERIAAMKVSDVASYQLMGDLLKEVRNVFNKIEKETRPEIKTADKLHKSLLARTKRWGDKFAEAETLGKAKLEHFYSEQVAANVDLPKLEGVIIGETWTGTVTDADALPRQYMVPDTAKLLAITKTLKEATDIAGWRARKVRTVTIRA